MILLDPFYRGGNWGSEKLRLYTYQMGLETRWPWFPKVGGILRHAKALWTSYHRYWKFRIKISSQSLAQLWPLHTGMTQFFIPILQIRKLSPTVYPSSRDDLLSDDTSHELSVKLTSLDSPSSSHSTPLPTQSENHPALSQSWAPGLGKQAEWCTGELVQGSEDAVLAPISCVILGH